MSVTDEAAEARRAGLVARISDSTVWRWLSEDAIKPWQHRCRIFPRDPFFVTKSPRIFVLYERVFEGESLKDDEFVLSMDEKTSIQARARRHPSLPNCKSHPRHRGLIPLVRRAVVGRDQRQSRSPRKRDDH